MKNELKKKYKKLRLILGDQLNAEHSWFKEKSKDTLYCIAELHQETRYVKHHIQKLCAFFAAMDNFAVALLKSGHDVLHLTLEDTQPSATLPELIAELSKKYNITTFEYQLPDEYRVKVQLESLSFEQDIQVNYFETEHFYLPFSTINKYIKPNHHNRLENFYRKMRKQFSILMDNDKPEGGQWNYDAENRKKLSKKDMAAIPKPKLFNNDIAQYKARIDKYRIPYFGEVNDTIIWPTSRLQAKQLLDFFCEHCLPNFGKFQDAMTAQHASSWSLYHSRLSFALNSKMINPVSVINQAISSYKKNSDINLAQIEGFIRQILGWREYVRGVYWQNMPDYSKLNFFKSQRKLPDFFWTAKTKMNCMHHAIKQSLEYSYAHHIQRLMITGNFCLLTGIDPQEVDEWYLGIYIDAIEWVEMPNTRGMSQFADHGIIATKPYAASGNYINKMSDYCKECHYKVKERDTEQSCPFNSLYWNFMNQHKSVFSNNNRMSMPYRAWEKMEADTQNKILMQSKKYINNIENL